MEDVKDKLVNEYKEKRELYKENTKYFKEKITTILEEKNIKYESIISRTKTVDSLSKKLTKNILDGIENKLKNIVDLSGVRVIFYNKSDMYNFLSELKSYFIINMIKKPRDREKYNAINVAATNNEKNEYNGLNCEIQLCTLLSHCINEFGHNIFYKDIENLKNKNIKEYNRLEDEYILLRRQADEIELRMENIKRKISIINNNYKNLLTLKRSNEILENITDPSKLSKFMEDISTIDDIAGLDDEIKQYVIKNNIIKKLVNKMYELRNTKDEIFKEYIYSNLIETIAQILLKYKSFWIKDFDVVITKFYRIITGYKNYDFDYLFERLISNLLIYDEINNNQFIFEKLICNLIINNKVKQLDIKLIKIVINIKSNVNFELLENEKTKYNVFNLLDYIFEKASSSDNSEYNKLILMSMRNFISSEGKKIINNLTTKYYKKLDWFTLIKMYDISIHLGYTFYNEEPIYSKSINNFEFLIYKTLFSDEYIHQFNEENISDKEIIEYLISNEEIMLRIINIYEKYCTEFRMDSRIITILYKLAAKIEDSKELYNKCHNIPLLAGMISNDETNFEFINSKKGLEQTVWILYTQKLYNENTINYIIKYNTKYKSDYVKSILLTIIFSNIKYLGNPKYKQYIILAMKNFVKKENKQKLYITYDKKIIEYILSSFNNNEIIVLIKGLMLLEDYALSEAPLKICFEIKPELFRKALEKINVDIYYLSNYLDLAMCPNYNNEIYNNIIASIKIIKSSELVENSNVCILVKRYNEEIEKNLLKYLDTVSDAKDIVPVLELCKILRADIKGWKVYEKVLSKKLSKIDKLKSIVHDCLFGFIEYTSEEDLRKKYITKKDFFRKIKTSNKNVKAFIGKIINELNNLISSQDEKIRLDEINMQISKKKD